MFQTLRGLGKFIEVMGWLVVVIAGLIFLGGLLTALGKHDSFGAGIALMSLIPSAASAILGIIIVSYGQAIQCFVAIEENTRETNRLLTSGANSGSRSETIGRRNSRCQQCSAVLDADSKFCNSCGAPV